METLDGWDEILRINMFGCHLPWTGYPKMMGGGKFGTRFDCNSTFQYGWLAAIYFLALIILGTW